MLETLTPEQAQAVTHPRGPLLVLAGAGAGKTRVLCHRLAWLIDQGADPGEVLALTFTRQAAEELRGRAEDLLGRSHETLKVQTFHSWALDLVRIHGVEEGLTPMVRQIDPELRKLIMLRRLHELDLRLTTGRSDAAGVVEGLVRRIDRCRDELVDAADYLEWAKAAVASAPHRKAEREARRELEFAEAFSAHDRWLADEGVEDFGMSLVRALELVRRHGDVRDAVRATCRHVLVDEFQDTNHAQAELLFQAAHPDGSLAVVGDDDQGIYRFRGASTKNIADFRARFPQAAEVRLERNYRSSQVILDAAWSVVAKVPDRVDKRLRSQQDGAGRAPLLWMAPDPAGQARAVVEEIVRQAEQGVAYEEQAVLMRAVRTEAAPIVAELERAGVPHQVRGGLGLLDRREVRVAMAWLRAVADPTDGQAHLRLAADARLGARWDVVADVVANARGTALRQALTEALGADAPLMTLLDDLGRRAAVDPPSAVIRAILDQVGLRAEAVAAGGAEGAARLAALAALERLIALLSADSPDADVAGVARTLWSLEQLGYRGEGGSPAERRGVQVMTIHQSKGLEFDVVYVVGLTHRNWPGRDRGRSDIPDALLPETVPNDPDAHTWEARRLAYVALTRARHTLVLSTVSASDQGVAQRPSVFLDDVMGEMPQLSMREVGAEPAVGLADQVGEARQRLEDATLAAARDAATGQMDAQTLRATAAQALDGLIAAQAAALRPHVPAAPVPRVPAVPREGMRIAVSALARFWRCPLQFKYASEDHIPGRADDPARGLGVATHETLERAFAPGDAVMDPPQMTALLTERCAANGVSDTAQARFAIDRSRETFPQLVAAHTRGGNRVHSVERSFTLGIGGHWLRGRIDRIDQTSGGFALIDYKTGNQPNGAAARDGHIVMRLYMLGADQALGIHAQQATLEYVFEGSRSRETPDQADMDEAIDTTREALDAIAHGRFEPTPGWVCRACDYRLLCPAQDR